MSNVRYRSHSQFDNWNDRNYHGLPRRSFLTVSNVHAVPGDDVGFYCTRATDGFKRRKMIVFPYPLPHSAEQLQSTTRAARANTPPTITRTCNRVPPCGDPPSHYVSGLLPICITKRFRPLISYRYECVAINHPDNNIADSAGTLFAFNDIATFVSVKFKCARPTIRIAAGSHEKPCFKKLVPNIAFRTRILYFFRIDMTTLFDSYV